MSIKTYENYRIYIKGNRDLNQVYNSFKTLEFWCYKDDVYNVKKSSNRVEIYLSRGMEGYELKRIAKKGNNLSMIHYNDYNIAEVSNNPILENIEDFKVYQKGNLTYIEVWKDGKKYLKCL